MASMRLWIFGFGLILLSLGTGEAVSGEFSSSWQDNPYARARLIATGYPDHKHDQPSVGLQIELNPGWKTYWRVPGDSGIPPQIKWEGSKNLKSIEVRWPAPHRFVDKYGMSIGYKNEIVLPVKIVPKDVNSPVQLSLELNYAVCSDICLPATANMALDIKPGKISAGPFKRKLTRFDELVPKTAKSTTGFKVSELKSKTGEKKVILSFEVKNPSGEPIEDVFVEGSETLFFGTSKKTKNKNGGSRIEVPVSGIKVANALVGSQLRFTLVGKITSTDQILIVGN